MDHVLPSSKEIEGPTNLTLDGQIKEKRKKTKTVPRRKRGEKHHGKTWRKAHERGRTTKVF